MKKNQNKKGFTLVELIVVIAILAVLGLLLVPQVTGYIAESKDAVGKANVKACYSSIVAAKAKAEAKLTTINVTIDPNCTPKAPITETTDINTVTWTDGAKVWTYDSATGEITSAAK